MKSKESISPPLVGPNQSGKCPKVDVPEEFAPQYTDENGNVRPPENFPYYDPIPGKLPIVCNGGYDTAAESAIFESANPGNKPAYEKMEKELKEFITKSTNEIVDCGFNMSLRYMWRPIYFRAQEIIANSGLKIVAEIPYAWKQSVVAGKEDDECTTEVYKLLNYEENGRKIDLSSVRAWLLGDEPTYLQLCKWLQCYYNLKVRIKVLPADCTTVFVNLAVSTELKYVGPWFKTIPLYLSCIQQLFRPALWSYDMYPVREEKDSKGNLIIKTDTKYYYFLDCFAKKAKQTGRPFWAYCICVRVGELDENGNEKWALATPTESRMRFEAFSSLAYGAQGLLYFTFRKNGLNDDKTESFSHAPIDANGNKTATYYAVKKVNEEIARYNNIFYGAQMLEVRHAGTTVWTGVTMLDGKFGPLERIRGNNPEVLVSLLKNGNQHYLVIVSHEPDVPQTIICDFDASMNVRSQIIDTIGPSSAEEKATVSPGLVVTMTINLKAGGYAIFSYDEK